MADIFSKRKRSQIMSRIRCAGTEPEQQLYQMVRSILGHRWRIDQNVQNLPGRPDIVIPTLQMIIFLDGCFYHSCPEHGHHPKSNQSYWLPKLRANQARDRANRRRLRQMGYKVISYWEHDLLRRRMPATCRSLTRIIFRIKSAVQGR